jgi:hypothetical protein
MEDRLQVINSNILKPFLQSGLVFIAVICGVDRIMDNKHHPSDVVAGFVLGIVVGLTVVNLISVVFICAILLFDTIGGICGQLLSGLCDQLVKVVDLKPLLITAVGLTVFERNTTLASSVTQAIYLIPVYVVVYTERGVTWVSTMTISVPQQQQQQQHHHHHHHQQQQQQFKLEI